MINLKYIIDTLFISDLRNRFKDISDNDKSKWGFIINRMMSKKFPEFAIKLNGRKGDYITVLNLWWIFLRDSNKRLYYNSWVWGSINSKSKKSIVERKDIDILQKRFPYLTIFDIEYLYEYYQEDFKNEIKYYKKLEEDNGRTIK